MQWVDPRHVSSGDGCFSGHFVGGGPASGHARPVHSHCPVAEHVHVLQSIFLVSPGLQAASVPASVGGTSTPPPSVCVWVDVGLVHFGSSEHSVVDDTEPHAAKGSAEPASTTSSGRSDRTRG